MIIISYNNLDVEDIFIKRNSKEDKIMKKKIGLLLATVMVLNTVSSVAYGFTNPLKNYNLYDDTHPESGTQNSSTERGMSDFYSDSMNSSSNKGVSSMDYSFPGESFDGSEAEKKRRNDVLRESSLRVFGDPGIKAGWEEGPSFYQNPSLESIIEKYRKSDFAGCLQECISYVRLNPNDTLGFYYLAMCYSKVSDKENAIKAYEKVISLNENPLIVKYATNGRNCVLGSEEEKCYPNVNEPELIYPYANIASDADLIPVDPDTLVNRNLVKLQEKLSPPPKKDKDSSGDPQAKDEDKNKINLPFGQQDEKLDRFINSPYGNGLAPDLNKEYKQLQLRKLQETINTGQDGPEKELNNIKYIKDFDNQKSDSETIKLAYSPSSELEKLSKDPEYVQSQRELDELNLLLGNDSSKKSNDSLTDLIPMLSEKDKNLSPEVIQAIMIKSMMPDFTFVNSDSKNLL